MWVSRFNALPSACTLGAVSDAAGDRLRYAGNQPYAAQLAAMRPHIAKLAALGARYNANAIFHTHSGIGVVGASIWDLCMLLKDFDPAAVGVNYDIGHATVEGGLGGWIDSFNICGPYVRGIAVKDFLWARNARGRWTPDWKPLGEGMVRLPQFFSWWRRRISRVRFNCISSAGTAISKAARKKCSRR